MQHKGTQMSMIEFIYIYLAQFLSAVMHVDSDSRQQLRLKELSTKRHKQLRFRARKIAIVSLEAVYMHYC